MRNGRTAIVSRIAAFAFAGMAAALLSPPDLIGEEMDFIPSVESITGSLELDVQRRDYKTNVGNNSTVNAYDANIEKIRLDTDGYVYHPRFLIFHLGGAAGLIQDYSIYGGATTRNSHGFGEYDAEVTMLPEHPYHLDLFARQQLGAPVPFTAESPVTSAQGAMFSYKQIPVILNLNATTSSYELGTNWSDSNNYVARGTYILGPTTNGASYNRTDSVTSQGEQVVRTDSSFNNTFTFGTLSLTSGIGSGRQSQSTLDASFIGTDTSNWFERLNWQLPLNLSVFAEHSVHKEQTAEQTPASPETTIFNKNTLDSISITHQLYSSLKTAYNASKQSIQTTEGDQDTSQQTLSINYAKNIPGGAVNAGYSFQDLESTQTGAVNIVNETHSSVVVPGVFYLYNQQADPSTITVMVRNPNPPNDLITLTVNMNYTVLPGNTVQITVMNLLGSNINPPAPDYTFVVSYSLLPNNAQTEMKTNAYNLRFSLFDGLFSPYISYSTSDLKVIFGSVPGGDSTTIVTTYGYSVQRMPFTFFMDHTDCQSTSNPYRSLRAAMDYRQALNEGTDVYARLYVSKMTHFATEFSGGSYDKTTSTELTFHKTFPHENVNLFAGGIYTLMDATGMTTKTYGLNASLTWSVGKLAISAIASKMNSISIGSIGGKQTSEENAYYLHVSRNIF